MYTANNLHDTYYIVLSSYKFILHQQGCHIHIVQEYNYVTQPTISACKVYTQEIRQ
jgi:hypothetical protein